MAGQSFRCSNDLANDVISRRESRVASPMETLSDSEEASSSAGSHDDTILTSEACALMKRRLPSYVVNSFIATGYDTLDVIAQINDEALAEIEKIINSDYSEDFSEDTCFTNQATHATSSASIFKFQPGHRKRIKMFVEEVQALVSARKASRGTGGTGKRRRHTSKASHVKFARLCDENSVDHECDVHNDNEKECCSELDLLTDFRHNFAKWQRQQKDSQLKEIKENQHFSVNIHISEGNINASLNCYMCGIALSLGVKCNTVLLSNWTRHLTQNCTQKQKPSKGVSKSLENYFTISYNIKSSNAKLLNQPISPSPALKNSEVKTASVTKETGT